MIPAEELEIKVFDPEGSGGFSFLRNQNGVQILHIPTGTMARYSAGRGQHINRAICLEMLEAALTHPRHKL